MINKEDVRQVVTHLCKLLADGDAEASQYYETNKGMLQTVLSQEFVQFDLALRNYDYETALGILTGAATN